MNAAFQSSIELLVLSTVCFLLSESFVFFFLLLLLYLLDLKVRIEAGQLN